MGKFLVGVILGALVAGNANASIISRSFLDEALTDYATTTALDLKANQSDITDLNTQISDSVDVLRQLFDQSGHSYDLVTDIDPEKYPNTISGAFSLLYGYLDVLAGSILNGWVDSNGDAVFGLRDITEDYYNTTRVDIRQLYDGWDAGNNTSYLGVIGLNDKIGTLPTESTSGQSIWYRYGFVKMASTPIELPDTIGGIFSMLFNGDSSYTGPSLNNILSKILRGFTDGGGNTETYGLYPLTMGIKSITDQIGTLPEGITVQGMYEGWTDSEKNTYLGVKRLNDKIGTLPTSIVSYEYDANGTLGYTKYPTAEVFGVNDNIGGMLAAILQGFSISGHRFLSLSEISTRTLRLSDQIGTLPDGYETVGAALTAMDAKIDARELPSTSDDGQYVLSAKKVGDTITYTWVRMDLTSEEQAQ